MALTFGTGGFALASWGFSVGDIAALAGAGRKIGTWLTAHLSDRALFDWMGTDVDTVFTRRGLLDVEALQRRWDRKIVLLQNGQVKTFETPPGAAGLHRMDRWTWLMTLFTAALEAAVSSIDLRSIMNMVLLQTFEEWEDSSDFLLRESSSHIAEWRSAACVRGLSIKARELWESLAEQGKHPAGFIPSSENAEIVCFLMWLMNGNGSRDDKKFQTASTDIFSLAILLEELGVLVKTTQNSPDSFDEGSTVIYWDRDIPYFSQYAHAKKRRRAGMRIPLEFIEEAGSLFPNTRNDVRQIMQDAIEAVSRDKIELTPLLPDENEYFQKNAASYIQEQEVEYKLSNDTETPVPRLAGDELRFVNWFLLKPGPAVCKAFLKAMGSLNDEDRHSLEMLAFTMDNQEQPDDRFHDLRLVSHDFGNAVAFVQAFVLGYWYAILRPLVHTYQMPYQEAFGSWSWSDLECLNLVRQCLASARRQKSSISLRRHEVLKLVGFLFGGADLSVVQTVKAGAIGILGKLAVLSTGLLGENGNTAGCFALLDIDPTCIPSSVTSIIFPGRPRALTRRDSSDMDTYAIADFVLDNFCRETSSLDCTTHIEPDWDNDAQTCLVAYRYLGRVIHRLDPRQVDMIRIRQQHGKVRALGQTSTSPDNDPPYHAVVNYRHATLASFHGGATVHPAESMANSDAEPPGYVFDPIFVNLEGMRNAEVVLLCMYRGWTEKGGIIPAIVSDDQGLEEALRNFSKLVLFCGEPRAKDLKRHSCATNAARGARIS